MSTRPARDVFDAMVNWQPSKASWRPYNLLEEVTSVLWEDVEFAYQCGFTYEELDDIFDQIQRAGLDTYWTEDLRLQ